MATYQTLTTTEKTILGRDEGNIILAPQTGGRVGIGTSNPEATLDIIASNQPNIPALQISNGLAATALLVDSLGNLKLNGTQGIEDIDDDMLRINDDIIIRGNLELVQPASGDVSKRLGFHGNGAPIIITENVFVESLNAPIPNVSIPYSSLGGYPSVWGNSITTPPGIKAFIEFDYSNDFSTAKGDSARIYRDDTGPNDFLVIEKTDGDDIDPDGGILFINRGSDNVPEIAMAIRGDGQVGIGTSNPAFTLDVNGAIRGNGRVLHTDVAEDYPVEKNVEYADIVAIGKQTTSLGKQTIQRLGRSRQAYDEMAIGIVSEHPGYRIYVNKPDWKPVALAGRVPVKANLENGPIAPGDLLTSSSKPGQAMKAVKSGKVIGIALEAFDSKKGTVLCFVNPHHWQANTLEKLEARADKIAALLSQ